LIKEGFDVTGIMVSFTADILEEASRVFR